MLPLTPDAAKYINKQKSKTAAQPCPLTSSAGVAQGAADFVLVQVGVRDHQDVGAPAQRAVVGSLAPHLLRGQCPAGQRRTGRNITGAGALPAETLPLSHRPGRQETKSLSPAQATWKTSNDNPRGISGWEVMREVLCLEQLREETGQTTDSPPVARVLGSQPYRSDLSV